jgi:RNA polymerase sigma factor (sigma-70 family)
MEISEFIEYVKRYRHEFVGIAHHYFHDEHEVEDAVQDALIRLWMARKRIEPPERFREYGAIATRNILPRQNKGKARLSLCGSGLGGRQDIRPYTAIDAGRV